MMTPSAIEDKTSTTASRLLAKQLNSLRDGILGELLPLPVSPTMTIAELRAIESLLSLRLELAHLNYDPDEPIYANLYYDRLDQIDRILTLVYDSALPVDHQIETLELLHTIRVELTGEDSPEIIAEANELKTRRHLTEFQALRIALMLDQGILEANTAVVRMLPKVKNSFDFGTLSGLFAYCTSDVRAALQTKFEQLLKAAFSVRATDEISSLLSLVAEFNADQAIGQKNLDLINSLLLVTPTLHYKLPRPIALLNAKAAGIHARIDAGIKRTVMSPITLDRCNSN